MPEFLSELEKESLATFVSNETMREAVRKVLLAPVYSNGVLEPGTPAQPLRNFALASVMQVENEGMGSAVSDEALGADLRAAGKAVRMIELGFTQLEKLAAQAATPAKAAKHKPGK